MSKFKQELPRTVTDLESGEEQKDQNKEYGYTPLELKSLSKLVLYLSNGRYVFQ